MSSRPDNGDVGQVISMDLGLDTVAATHPVQIDFPRFVAPSLASDDTHNTVKEFLIVVGCQVVPNAHFEFDRSFVRFPEARESFVRLAALRDILADPDQPADPSDPNNNALNRRVEVKIYPAEK